MSAAEIVLPCLDEAAALPSVLAALPPGWPVFGRPGSRFAAALARVPGLRTTPAG